MKFRKMSSVLMVILITGCSSTLTSKGLAEIQSETIVVQRTDESEVTAFIEKPETNKPLPIVLYVDGSGCVSASRERFVQARYRPQWIQQTSATLVIEKSGVEAGAPWGSSCSMEFAKYYSIDQRVLDHLLVFQYLRTHASWWNGEILLIGWSDGAAIGSHVAAYTPEVKKVVLGGMGGGIPMWKQFEDYIICAEDRTENRDQCVAEVRRNFDEIRNNPSPSKFWSGMDSSYKVWATRLDQIEYYLLKNMNIPILIMHGELDRDSVPVQSARELVRKLEEDRHATFEYWEVPKMEHGIGNLGAARAKAIRLAMLNWLFDQPLGSGGPPSFGADRAD